MAHLACPRLAVALPLLLALAAPQATPDAPDEWQDPAVSGRNREPAHATMLPYATVEQALEGTREASPFYRSLNSGAPGGGRWKFHYVAKPADRPRDFHRTDFDDRSWAEITVPSNWQLQGYDKPIYLNTRYPWAPEHPDPPTIPPDYNPVGSYRTTFEVPAAWAGRRVFLHFAGVNSAFHLWVNGQWVGYSEDSMTPAEFDVTPSPEAGREPPGRPGLPLVGRELPRGPGHLAPERHLPRRVPLLDPEPPDLRLLRADGPRRGLPRRDAARPAEAPLARRGPRRGLHRRGAALRRRAPPRLRDASFEGREARSSTRSTRSATPPRSGSSRRRSKPPACGRPRRPTSTPSSCR